MNNENLVVFKGTKDGITVLLNEDSSFPELKEQLEKKVLDASKFFDGVKTSIAFRGKVLDEEQEQALLTIISEMSNMTITFLRDEDASVKPAVFLSPNLEQHNIAHYHTGSIRSGQSLEFEGSVVLTGDVNPGGVIKASGNIIILGQLKGIAHAGCNGYIDAFVFAIYMIPVQLRIAEIITLFPDENKKGVKPPEYAYVEDGQIYVMPLS